MNTSNKTLERPAKKTASAPKPQVPSWVGYAVVAVGLVSFGIGLLIQSNATKPTEECVVLSCVSLERVNSPKDLQQGLSGRTSLPEDGGMLFEFDRSAKWCMWMKDMQFPIDMIWLNNNKQVVHIVRDVTPETYPERFCPPQQARYVIEVNAGMAVQARLVSGSQLQF